MSFMDYKEAVQPIDPAGFVMAIGGLVAMGVMMYIIYRLYIKLVQWIDVILNREMKYEILEESYLNKMALKQGIDLDKELIKRKIINGDDKNLKKRVQDEVFKSFFANDKNKEGDA